jgi:hypothetical protein
VSSCRTPSSPHAATLRLVMTASAPSPPATQQTSTHPSTHTAACAALCATRTWPSHRPASRSTTHHLTTGWESE